MQEGYLTVALLLHDLSEVKEISTVFRKLGIIPHFYEDLKTFWTGMTERPASLAIIDVKKMNEEGMLLKDHPLIIAEKLPLVFYYTQNTAPLLYSTFELFHLGQLKKSEHYEGPLKVILKRLNRLIKLETENDLLNFRLFNQNEELEKLKYEKLNLKNTEDYQALVKSICLLFEGLRGKADFFSAVLEIFTKVDEILEFSLFELSFNGQKLITPISNCEKYRAHPSLWLGQACFKGIELFAQNMASQIAIEVMGGPLVSLFIKGDYDFPDKILFVKVKNELFFNQFDWPLLEAYLNGFYASYLLAIENQNTAQNKTPSPFEAMSLLDLSLYGSTHSQLKNELKDISLNSRLISLDLSTLIETIISKKNNRFYWGKFEKDFLNKLEIQTRVNFKFFNFGCHTMNFLVEASQLDYFFDAIKDFSRQFSYWKYFEESEGVLSQLFKTKVQMIPVSAFAFIKFMNDNEIERAEKSWGKGQNQKSGKNSGPLEIVFTRENLHEI